LSRNLAANRVPLRRIALYDSLKRIRSRPIVGDAMLFSSLRTLVKVAVASLIVGTILSHFGITADALLREAGITPDRVYDYSRKAWDWAAPNVMLGAIVIVPIWFLIFLFRPPGASSD
jgi:hypothetical protein